MQIIVSLLLCGIIDAQAGAKFDRWKASYANRASKRGIPKAFVTQTLKDVELDQEVLDLSSNQAILDKKRDYHAFIKKWLREGERRILRGREMLETYRDLLARVEKRYGVDREVIVALWGTETFYGEIMGKRDVVRSLATLAFGSHRKRFFETQLSATLRLLRGGHVKREMLLGSWAGATGQCQFMPSNFDPYARDFDGDGKKDIWGNHGDIFASIAHYLKKVGWQRGKSIGSLAVLGKKKPRTGRYYTKKQYNEMGLRSTDGNALSGKWNARKMATIPLKNSPVILRGSNYKPLLAWNNSSLFAAFNIILIEGYQSQAPTARRDGFRAYLAALEGDLQEGSESLMVRRVFPGS